MKKEAFDALKKEITFLCIIFLALAIILKIVYLKEDLIVVLRMTFSLFWLFLLPGYFLMSYWNNKLDFTERIIIGSGLSAAIIGIFSYYLGLLGLDMKYHAILLPLGLIGAGLVIMFRKKSSI